MRSLELVILTVYFYILSLEVSNQIWYILTNKMPIGTKNFDLETYRNKLEKNHMHTVAITDFQ